MSLFNILVDIAAKTASFESGIDRIEKHLQHFGETVRRVIEFEAGRRFLEFGKSVIDAGASMEQAAVKASVSAKAFSELVYVGKQANISQSELADTFTKMNRAISEASTGGAKQNETLHALGLTFRDLQGLAPEEQFELLADRISKLGNAGDKARAEVVLFGKSGADLGPAFAKGAEGIRKAREEAQQLGASFSEEQLKSLEEAHKSIERLETAFSSLATTLVAKVAPGISSILDKFTALFSQDPVLKLQEQINSLKEFEKDGGYASIPIFFTDFLAGKGYGDLPMGVYSAQDTRRQRERLEDKLDLMRSVVRPSQLENPSLNALLASGGRPPGYQPEIDPVNVTAQKLAGRSGVNPILDQWDQQTRRALESADAEFTQTEARLKGLFQDNVINFDEFNRRMDEARQKFNNAIDLSPVFISAKKQVDVFLTQAQRNVREFVGDFKGSLDQAAHQGGAFGKNFATALIRSLEDRAIFRAIDAIGAALERALTNSTGGTGLLGSVLSGIFGAGGGGELQPVTPTVSKLPAFANGGSFTVGGYGGIDSQVVAFRATPGEPVSVGGGHGGMVFAPQYYIDARGATTDLIQVLPAVLQQNNEALKAEIMDEINRRPPRGR